MAIFDIFTILFLVLAVVIILKLRNVLGRRSGVRGRTPRACTGAGARGRSVRSAGCRQGRQPAASRPAGGRRRSRGCDHDGGRRSPRAHVRLGRRSSPTRWSLSFTPSARFDPDHFLAGAKAAYEMIVTAFAEGNRKTLKNLLSREVYDGFAGAISDRESRGEQVDQSFVGIKSADIVEAELKNGMAQLTVKFVSELISATRDKAGEVISGDPKRIKEVTDIWTFAREVGSRNPNWKLVATQARELTGDLPAGRVIGLTRRGTRCRTRMRAHCDCAAAAGCGSGARRRRASCVGALGNSPGGPEHEGARRHLQAGHLRRAARLGPGRPRRRPSRLSQVLRARHLPRAAHGRRQGQAASRQSGLVAPAPPPASFPARSIESRAKAFFEREFHAQAVVPQRPAGLLTGYYEPLWKARARRRAPSRRRSTSARPIWSTSSMRRSAAPTARPSPTRARPTRAPSRSPRAPRSSRAH